MHASAAQVTADDEQPGAAENGTLDHVAEPAAEDAEDKAAAERAEQDAAAQEAALAAGNGGGGHLHHMSVVCLHHSHVVQSETLGWALRRRGA